MTPRKPFLIFALPRSRTAWMAAFLSHERTLCHHEPSATFETPLDLWALLQEPIGICDSMMTLLWRDALRFRPDARVVTVRRPLEDVLASAAATGVSGPRTEHNIRRIAEELALVEENADLTLAYDELATEEGCRRLFEFCLDRPFDVEWWQSLANRNIQCDISRRRREVELNLAGFRRIYGPHLQRAAG